MLRRNQIWLQKTHFNTVEFRTHARDFGTVQRKHHSLGCVGVGWTCVTKCHKGHQNLKRPNLFGIIYIDHLSFSQYVTSRRL